MTKHIFISILLALSLLSGCSKQHISPIAVPSPARTPEERADRAFEAMQYEAARELYRTLLTQPGTSPFIRARYYERVAEAGLALNDPAGAGQTLTRWAAEDPGAEDTLAWQRLHLQVAAKTMDGPDYLTAVRETLNRPTLSWPGKQTLGSEQFEALWGAEKREDALSLSGALHQAAPDQAARQELERNFLSLAGSMTPETRTHILAAASEQDKERFPFSLVAWAEGQHLLTLSPDNWPAAYELLRLAPFSSDLVDRQWYRNELTGLEHHFGPSSRSVALLLPMSGPLGTIGQKIARGAQCALLGQPRTGRTGELRIINSAGPDWKAELSELGPEFTVVGGPLRKEIWQGIRQDNLQSQRLFLTFMSSLPGEGVDGWRFFGSPTDQARTVIRAAMQQHGITDFAVFYPKERFGSAMAEAFWQTVKAEGGSLKGMGTYPPNSPRELGQAVATLLKAPSGKSQQKTPAPDFQAVFLPDSLTRAQLVAPQFFFYDAKDLLFLGPQVWNQAFLGGSRPELQYLSRALFPGAWWPDNPKPAMARLQQEFARYKWGTPGFWAGLGYDFTRFAEKAGTASPLSPPDQIASVLHAAAAGMSGWTIAPLDWDEKGQARQTMFLFRPGAGGPVRIQPKAVQAVPQQPAMPPPSKQQVPGLTETNIPS